MAGLSRKLAGFKSHCRQQAASSLQAAQASGGLLLSNSNSTSTRISKLDDIKTLQPTAIVPVAARSSPPPPFFFLFC